VASIQTLERRILALEARLADLEAGYGETLHRLHRASAKADLRMDRVLAHLSMATRGLTWVSARYAPD
jgi:uncharacterized coiled-coil protein SlyX